jgi:hypothetical protein
MPLLASSLLIIVFHDEPDDSLPQPDISSADTHGESDNDILGFFLCGLAFTETYSSCKGHFSSVYREGPQCSVEHGMGEDFTD